MEELMCPVCGKAYAGKIVCPRCGVRLKSAVPVDQESGGAAGEGYLAAEQPPSKTRFRNRGASLAGTLCELSQLWAPW